MVDVMDLGSLFVRVQSGFNGDVADIHLKKWYHSGPTKLASELNLRFLGSTIWGNLILGI